MQKWFYAGGILLLLVLVGFVGVPAVSDHLNDAAYISTWNSADVDLTPMYNEWFQAKEAWDYSRSTLLGTNLSIKSKYWYDKISPLPVSAKMSDTKSARLQALSEEQAAGDEWAKIIPKYQLGIKDKIFADVIEGRSGIQNVTDHINRMKIYNQIANESFPK